LSNYSKTFRPEDFEEAPKAAPAPAPVEKKVPLLRRKLSRADIEPLKDEAKGGAPAGSTASAASTSGLAPPAVSGGGGATPAVASSQTSEKSPLLKGGGGSGSKGGGGKGSYATMEALEVELDDEDIDAKLFNKLCGCWPCFK
jgi:transcription elongation factor